MNIARKYPVLGSSVNPDKVGLTAKGVALGLIPLVIVLFRFFGMEVTEVELVELIEAVAAVASVITVLIGLIRKFVVKFKNRL